MPVELAGLAPFLCSLECGAVVTDRAGNVKWANARLCRMLGYSSGKLLAGSPSFRPFGEHTGRTCASMWRAVLSGHVYSIGVNDHTRTGDRVPVLITLAPLADAFARTHMLLVLRSAQDTPGERRRARKTAERAMELWSSRRR